MNELNDRDKLVLRMVQRRFSVREMARDLNVGLGTVQDSLQKLELGGFVTNPPGRLARMRQVTEKGQKVLRAEGLS